MAVAVALMQENVWLQRQRFEEAEAHFYAVMAGTALPGALGQGEGGGSSIRNEISQARQEIQRALKQPGGQGGAASPQVQKRLDELEKENRDLKKATNDLKALVMKLEGRVAALEGGKGGAAKPAAAPAPAKPAPKDVDSDDDDDCDLFGSSDEDEEAKAAEKAKRLADYAARKSKKPALIAKSNIILDVKPWDDETDMAEMEKLVRSVETDGLLWGASKLVPLAYGIKKLQISCVVEDAKVGTDFLEEEIGKFEDLVQSVDIAAFNKV